MCFLDETSGSVCVVPQQEVLCVVPQQADPCVVMCVVPQQAVLCVVPCVVPQVVSCVVPCVVPQQAVPCVVPQHEEHVLQNQKRHKQDREYLKGCGHELIKKCERREGSRT